MSADSEAAVPQKQENEAVALPWLRPELIAPWWEIILAFLLVQGHFIYGSAKSALYRTAQHAAGHSVDVRLTDYKAFHLVAAQSILLALFLIYLHWRGWRRSDLRIVITPIGIALGLALALATLAIDKTSVAVIRVLLPPQHLHLSVPLHYHVTHFGIAALMASQIINALFEEITCMSYAFNQVAAKRGPTAALFLMLLLRASYHTYKTPAFLVVTLVFFALYGLLYWRIRNVFPLVLGHTVYDMIVLAPQLR